MIDKRCAGVLLHITSLPTKYGVGTLGKEAYEFVDWLEKSKMSIWQVLPLMPTNYGDSPYQSVSSTALNYYLIDLDILCKKGYLKEEDFKDVIFGYTPDRVNYEALFNNKVTVLKKAFDSFDKSDKSFVKFVESKKYNDFAVFMTLKSMHEYKQWTLWDEKYIKYSAKLEEEIITKYNDDYLFWIWTQFEFMNEWNELHNYAKSKGISIMGDMPLYVAYDSVEVWKYPHLFDLTEDSELKFVAGCPPDMFSEDGQLWGNPVYDWAYMKETNYEWWNERIARIFEQVDILRIDHFRGFDRYYSIPAADDTARNGEWVDGPKFDLFKDKLDLNIVAEDLGVIDEGVLTLMEQTNYPGMKVLEFCFDGKSENEHKPSNYKENHIVYTGTHDNMPFYQFVADMDEEEKEILVDDLIYECALLDVDPKISTIKEITETAVELAYASTANACIIPIQDLLAADGTTRMNFPSTVSTNNWSYRVSKEDLSDELSDRLVKLVEKYNR